MQKWWKSIPFFPSSPSLHSTPCPFKINFIHFHHSTPSIPLLFFPSFPFITGIRDIIPGNFSAITCRRTYRYVLRTAMGCKFDILWHQVLYQFKASLQRHDPKQLDGILTHRFAVYTIFDDAIELGRRQSKHCACLWPTDCSFKTVYLTKWGRVASLIYTGLGLTFLSDDLNQIMSPQFPQKIEQFLKIIQKLLIISDQRTTAKTQIWLIVDWAVCSQRNG